MFDVIVLDEPAALVWAANISATVAAPVQWSEVETVAATGEVRPLVFLLDAMPRRLDDVGDLFAGMHDEPQRLPASA